MAKTEPAPLDAAAARRLMRAADRAAVATRLAVEPRGWPYASLVLPAFDHDGAPLIFLSDLSEHARNLAADPRLALLIDGMAGHEDPLAGPRLTLVGSAARDDRERLRRRFVARHPSAAAYAGFADFHLYRVSVERAHFVAGFGRIRWIDGASMRVAIDPEAFAPADAMVGPLNEAHAAAIDAVGRRLARRRGGGWRLTGLDPEGADLRRPGAVARLDFAAPQPTPEAARAALLAALGV